MLTTTNEGVLIAVRVVPRAARAGLAGIRDNALLVRLRAAPVEGAANAELIEVLAETLGVARRAVSISSGERSRRKTVLFVVSQQTKSPPESLDALLLQLLRARPA